MDKSLIALRQVITANAVSRQVIFDAGVPAREIALFFFHILITVFGILRFSFRFVFAN